MKNLIHLFFAVTCILISPIFATTPKLEMPVEITNIKIVNVFHDNVLVEVEYLTKIDNSGILSLNVSDNIDLLDKVNLKTRNKLETRLQLVKDRTDKKLFSLKQQEGTSLVHFTIEIPDAPPGYKKEVSKSFKIIRQKNSYSIYDPRNPGDLKPKEIGKDVIIKQGTGNALNKGSSTESEQNYSVSIIGKIEIQNRNKGLYGNGVALWFRNTSNPDSWYHPVYSENNILHTHYDILDEQGNFNFDFSFTGDLSGYNQAIVIVNTANAAANLPAPADGYVSWGPNGFTKYFNESEGIVASINGGNANITINQDGVVNYQDGSVLRYLQLAREFVAQKYGGSLPFSLPNIAATIEDMSPAGEFRFGWWPTTGDWCYIAIDPTSTEFSTVSHEYGHYVNYRMWGGGYSKMADAHPQLKEGWAIFYSFATRNYGNVMYNDLLRGWDDNTEEAPFQENPRYYGIRYTHSGHPEYGAAGSFFWSLYDSYNNVNFEVSLYSGDNDDIAGYSNRVFDKLKTLNTTHTAAYIDHFKNGLNSTIDNSVDDMVSFIFDDYYEIPSHKMRASQVKDFQGQINSNNTQITFTWVPQNYSGTKDYGNYETGYKIYKENGSSWQLIATLPIGETNYSYNSPNVNQSYKITSYNSSGESLNAPVVSPLTITISGPSVLYADGARSVSSLDNEDNNAVIRAPAPSATGTWTANASGGDGQYTYQWYYLSSDGVTWYTQYGGTNKSLTKEIFRSTTFKCEVTSAGETESATKYVQFVSGGGPMVASLDNYPNPFNPTTKIRLNLPSREEVKLVVYNVLGEQIITLQNGVLEKGIHEIEWNGRNQLGAQVSSGLYLYSLEFANKRITKKMFLAK